MPTKDDGSRSKRSPKLSASDAAAAAMEQIENLTARKPVMVTSVEPSDEGWFVGVEIVEDSRVPSSSDILALYEVELDEGGELRAYRRTQRYVRGRTGTGREVS